MRRSNVSFTIILNLCALAAIGLGRDEPVSASADSMRGDGSYVSVVSELLMDFFEGLPKTVVRRLLNDAELTDFIAAHEDQVFSQKVLTVSLSRYDVLHEAVKRIVSESQLRKMESLITFNVTKPSKPPASALAPDSANATSSSSAHDEDDDDDVVGYPLCVDRFDDESRHVGVPFRGLPTVKTIVEMEYVFSHPMIKIYAGKSGIARILNNPNLLRELKGNKNKLLTVLFLDMSLISLLDTELYCYQILSEETVSVRFGVAFGKTLNAMQLAAIPSYFSHISHFAKNAWNASSIVFRFLESNFTSEFIHVSGTNPNPCLFFDILDSCRNGGVCVGFTGIGNCRCRKGFTGKFCKSTTEAQKSSSVTGTDRWLNFAYMLVGVVLVSVTIIGVGHLVKSCAVDGYVGKSTSRRGDVDRDGITTPYHLPRIAVTASSTTSRPRDVGASFSVDKVKKRRGASLSETKPSESSTKGVIDRDQARHNHLTVP